MKALNIPKLIQVIMDSKLPAGVLRKLNPEYWRRLFVLNKDSSSNKLRTDLYETGVLRRNTKVTEDGVITMDYILYVESKLGVDIVSFTEEELELIEEALAKEMEGEIKTERIKWQV